MKPRPIKTLLLAIGVLSVTGGSLAPEPLASDAEVIRFGATRSSLILSGRILGSRGGGGGATATVKIDEILRAPSGFQTPESVAVHYLSAKEPFIASGGKLPYTNSYLFFLRPASTNAETGYHDVTDKDHPFVRANETNVRFLRKQLQEKK